jgi:hypothetical protein
MMLKQGADRYISNADRALAAIPGYLSTGFLTAPVEKVRAL